MSDFVFSQEFTDLATGVTLTFEHDEPNRITIQWHESGENLEEINEAIQRLLMSVGIIKGEVCEP